MVEPQTVSELLSRLEQQGYTKDFRAKGEELCILPDNIRIDPAKLMVDAIHRFEGDTDLNDEEMVFALSCPQLGIKGTYVVAFGSMMDPADARIVQRLKKQGQKKTT